MANVNRGKDFENVVREAFKRVPDTMVTRLPDPVQGYLGVRNISDFLIYHYPYQYIIECKSVHGNLLPFHNITHNQWSGMLEASENKGVIAGVLCWWIDFDITRFIPICELDRIAKIEGKKSIRYDRADYDYIDFTGTKKRVFFEYDAESFMKDAESSYSNVVSLSDII